MNKFLLVGAGGFVGAIARYWLGTYIQAVSQGAAFPYATLLINVTGCLVIGFLAHLALHNIMGLEMRLLLITGFLGAYTTFSTFGNETVLLIQSNKSSLAFAYIAASLTLGLGAVWIGQWLAGRMGY
ncbi:MAG: fluoride efflux transporter CrcB [Caldilineaceae bacterium]